MRIQPSELREKTIQELEILVSEHKASHLRLRQQKSSQSVKPHEIRTVKRTIARIKTIITEKIYQQKWEEHKNDKRLPKDLRPRLTKAKRNALTERQLNKNVLSVNNRKRKYPNVVFSYNERTKQFSDKKIPLGSLIHTCSTDLVIKVTSENIPYPNSPIMYEDKKIGAIDEVLGKVDAVYATIKLDKVFDIKKYKSGNVFYAFEDKFISKHRFLGREEIEKMKEKKDKKVGSDRREGSNKRVGSDRREGSDKREGSVKRGDFTKSYNNKSSGFNKRDSNQRDSYNKRDSNKSSGFNQREGYNKRESYNKRETPYRKENKFNKK